MQTAQEVKEPLGEQAARFSMYAPIAVLMIGCFSRVGGNQDAMVTAVLFWINVALIVAGFALGIFALVWMQKEGPERILVRAIIGVALNGAALALLLAVLLPAFRASQFGTRAIGHWQIQSSPDPTVGQIDFTLNKNGDFQFNSITRDGQSMSMSGTWVVTRDHTLGVQIVHVRNGRPALIGEKIALGRIKQVDDKQLVLTTDKGDEIYRRTH